MLTIMEKVDVLQKAALLREIPTESLARIAAIAQEISFDTRQMLYTENEASDLMFVVLEGEVALVMNGREERTLGAHQVVGALALLAGGPEPESAVATRPTRTLQIEQQEFYDAMAEDFNITRGILRALVRLAAH